MAGVGGLGFFGVLVWLGWGFGGMGVFRRAVATWSSGRGHEGGRRCAVEEAALSLVGNLPGDFPRGPAGC